MRHHLAFAKPFAYAVLIVLAATGAAPGLARAAGDTPSESEAISGSVEAPTAESDATIPADFAPKPSNDRVPDASSIEPQPTDGSAAADDPEEPPHEVPHEAPHEASHQEHTLYAPTLRGADQTHTSREGTDSEGEGTEDRTGEQTEGQEPQANIDGRTPQRQGARGALWVPRVALSPLYFVSEFVLRRPLGALVTWAEHEDVPAKVANALSFGTGGRVGLYPTAFFDFGLRPSVGLYFFANDVPGEDDRLRVSVGYGGSRWWKLSIRERIHLGGTRGQPNERYRATRLNLGFDFNRRPDHLFYGFGHQGEGGDGGAFEESRITGSVDLEAAFGELDGVSLGMRAGRARFAPGDGDLEKADGRIDRLYDVERLDGWEGYVFAEWDASITLDTRPADLTEPGAGWVFEPFGSVGVSLDSTDYRWARYGVHVAKHWEPGGRGRRISIHHHFERADAIGGGVIPFTEHASLGGTRYLRGFVTDRFRGTRAVATMLEYTYPIWALADGFAWYSVGQSSMHEYDVYAFEDWVSSFGLGLRSNGDRDGGVSLLVGFGMQPFYVEGYKLEDVRVMLGFTQGL